MCLRQEARGGGGNETQILGHLYHHTPPYSTNQEPRLAFVETVPQLSIKLCCLVAISCRNFKNLAQRGNEESAGVSGCSGQEPAC